MWLTGDIAKTFKNNWKSMFFGRVLRARSPGRACKVSVRRSCRGLGGLKRATWSPCWLEDEIDRAKWSPRWAKMAMLTLFCELCLVIVFFGSYLFERMLNCKFRQHYNVLGSSSFFGGSCWKFLEKFFGNLGQRLDSLMRSWHQVGNLLGWISLDSPVL